MLKIRKIKEKHHRLALSEYCGLIQASFTICVQKHLPIFVEPKIVNEFVDVLHVACKKYFCVNWAYVFMPDHAHITIEGVKECSNLWKTKGIWRYFYAHWFDWFPNLGTRVNFVKQAENLCWVKQRIQHTLAKQLCGFSDTLHMADGFPMPVCKFKRAKFSSVFKGLANYGYCASKAETYYGFKGNVMINSECVIANLTVAAANIDERESLWDITENIRGLVIADKGLIGSG